MAGFSLEKWSCNFNFKCNLIVATSISWNCNLKLQQWSCTMKLQLEVAVEVALEVAVEVALEVEVATSFFKRESCHVSKGNFLIPCKVFPRNFPLNLNLIWYVLILIQI